VAVRRVDDPPVRHWTATKLAKTVWHQSCGVGRADEAVSRVAERRFVVVVAYTMVSYTTESVLDTLSSHGFFDECPLMTRWRLVFSVPV